MTRLPHREEFVAANRSGWVRLEYLGSLAAHGKLERFTTAEMFELGDLYRRATSDLAIARRDFAGDRVETYLNGLVSRTHAVVYTQEASSVLRIKQFVQFGFPAAVREAWSYIFVAFVLFVFSGCIAAVAVAIQPSMADVFMPGQAQSLRSVMAHHHLWVQAATEDHSVAANYIMVNNIRVAFLAFAGGMLAGVFAFYILAVNGINLGVVSAMVAQNNLGIDFWAFVAPHGIIELTVVFLAGGAGLMIGDAILRPGLRRRSDALASAVRTATYILLGCIPLLVVAGAIESFFSPSSVPNIVKFTVSVVLGTALYSYLFLSKPTASQPRYDFEDILTVSPVP